MTALDLAGNNLVGTLADRLGSLEAMTRLRVGGNRALAGRLPLSLTGLALVELSYAGTGLCVPKEARFQAWLAGVSSHHGAGTECAPLSDRDILAALYRVTDGQNWAESRNWLSEAPLAEWHGVSTDDAGRVTRLVLFINKLVGPIPPEIGGLAQLTELVLQGNALSGTIPPEIAELTHLRIFNAWDNRLTGQIPPELGSLADMEVLVLGGNRLTGEIPRELGGLARLRELVLVSNALSGDIPAELGQLTDLRYLGLTDNALTGPIPPELGGLPIITELELGHNRLEGPIPPELGNPHGMVRLVLADNALTGPVPHEFGGLKNLWTLDVTLNTALSGPLPRSLTNLTALDALTAGRTGLCAPADPGFTTWLNGIRKRRIATCGASAAAAYLTQAVQHREFPVPLVADEEALLRAFVTASRDNDGPFPSVRASFYLGGTLAHVADIPGRAGPVRTDVREHSLSASANVRVPAHVVQPGLEVVVEVDPDGALDPTLGVTPRIPATGRLAVDVQAMPLFDLTAIPFLWTSAPDSTILEVVAGMADDPEGHELLRETHTLLPVASLRFTAHEPVASSSNNIYALLEQTAVIRVMEGGGGHYMGMMAGPVFGGGGVALTPGRISYAGPWGPTIAHELGHNMSLLHAPCGGAAGPDPAYPHPDGSIGAWGYDFREGGRLVVPRSPDLMSYCRPNHWISDFSFTTALRHRLADERPSGGPAVASLLVWGGVSGDGDFHLEPAFVVDAPAALPDSAGDYRIIGRTGDGGELFSLSFAMTPVADGDGRASFVFAVPVRPEWGDDLASVTFSGPGGSANLNEATDRPMVILRDPRTGRVRGFLRDAAAAADRVGPPPRGLEALFSRGMPDPEQWRR